MTDVGVSFGEVGPDWAKACRQAVKDLNELFSRKGIAVVLSTGGTSGPTISVRTDPGILGTAVHGNTTAETTTSGRLLRAEVRLPVKVVINTPSGIRAAGPGVLEVIAAHELVHALGRTPHDSHLMAQTMSKRLGDGPAGDRLQAGGITMPPLQLAQATIDELKSIWT